MASETMPDPNYYATSQPLAHDHNDLERAGAETYDSLRQHRIHGGVGLSDDTRAITTNGYDLSPTQPPGHSPDEFYKGFAESSNGSNATIRNEISNLSATRQQPSHASRSASSATPKYPTIQSRTQPSKPSHRSASAPVVDRAQPRVDRSAAVQDRIKMFDQKSGQASSIPRGTSNDGSPRIPDLTSPSSSESSRKNFTAGQATREPFSSRVKSPQPPRTTQRPRFTVEDQHSNNTLASAARSSEPRSRSDAPADAPWAGRGTPLSPPTSRPPLFGEIVVSESGSQIPYGISEPRGHTRRSVDSTIRNYRPKSPTQQGRSPSSPSEDWYRVGGHSRDSDSPGFPGKHSRSMSDSYSSPMQTQSIFEAVYEPKSQMRSRLPVMSKPTTSTPGGSGPSSGRSSSAMAKRIVSNSSEYQPTPGRSYSPQGHDGYRGRGTRGRNTSKPPANIRAMITPLSPPMKSPPLRSSKIRLPVSSASTASSRNKMTEKAGPARSRAASRAESREGMRPAVRPDFAARRARIQEGMHKRAEEIKEKEQQAQEAQERAEIEQAAAYMQAHANMSAEDGNEGVADLSHEVVAARQPSVEQDESPILPQTEHIPFHRRSPALGMPGSFPMSQRASADTPVSAISTNSVETLFDNELQTEPPTQQDTNLTDMTRESVDSFEYPGDHTLAKKEEVVNFMQLLAEANEDLGGDPNRSFQYSEDESTVLPAHQPRSWNTLNTKNSTERVQPNNHGTNTNTETPSPQSRSRSHSVNFEIGHVSALPSKDAQEESRQSELLQNSRPESPRPRPSWQIQPTSPPRSSNSQLPKLQTSASHLRPFEGITFNTQDSALSAATDNEGECSTSSAESPRMSVERRFVPGSRNNDGQDGTYDRHRPAPSENIFKTNNWTSWPEGRVTEAQINDLVRGAPPPPPKEPIHDQAPAVPPKSDGYTPLLTPRPHGEHRGDAKSYASSNDMSFRARTQHAKSFEGGSNSSGPVSANPSTHSVETSSIGFGRGNGSSPNLWDHDVSLQLRPYPQADSNLRRESGDTGQYRPSTSTARSSAFLSNGSDNADTPVSSTDQAIAETPHDECPVGVAEFTSILQRKNHLMELVDTEAAFNKDMNVLVEIYQGTAVAVPDLRSGDISTIFRNANQIIEVSRDFLADLKETVMPVYAHRSARTKARTGEGQQIGEQSATKMYPTLPASEIIETKQNDERTAVGQVFLKHIPAMLKAYTRFINGSSAATIRIQELTAEFPSIKVWLEECNDAASDLSAAWDLGSMLVKPMQRITKYPMMINDLLKQTVKGDKMENIPPHPDRRALEDAYAQMSGIVKKINEDTARVELVLSALSEQQKKKDLATSGGLVKMFRRDKTEIASLDRVNEDPKYLFCVDRYHSEYARVEIIIRDIQGYIDKVEKQTQDFLRLLSAIELVMRASASGYPELESKWARFNLSMRDMGTIGLEEHLKSVVDGFLGPFEGLSRAYHDVQPTIGLRNKRRPKFFEYEKLLAKFGGDEKIAKGKIEDKLVRSAKEYTALNETLKMELPKLSVLNEQLKHTCLGGFVAAQVTWWSMWNKKLRTMFPPDVLLETEDIRERYHADVAGPLAYVSAMKLTNGTLLAEAKAGRNSESTVREDDTSVKSKSRTSTINDRSRGYSVHSDYPPSSFLSPSLKPTQNEHSPSYSTANSSGWSLAQTNKRDTGNMSHHGGDGAGSNDGPRTLHSSRALTESRRTSTDSRQPRPSGESFTLAPTLPSGARSPVVTLPSTSTLLNPGGWVDGLPPQEPAFSDLFKSALPWSNSEEDLTTGNVGNVYGNRATGHVDNNPERPDNHAPKTLYVVASLTAFHIDKTKMEANYPYLTYQEGEIFDVVAEKGELWLAKNQDDAEGKLGWIWNQHFARISSAE